MATNTAITYDIGGWGTVIGTKVDLYLDPTGKNPDVYTLGYVGRGALPAEAISQKHLRLGSVPVGASESHLESWLRKRGRTLAQIAAGHSGAKKWTKAARKTRDQFSKDLKKAFACGALPQYQTADDWLAAEGRDTPKEIAAQVTKAGGVKKCATKLMAKAKRAGALLRRDDLVDTLEWILLDAA